jgi:hypothetical protein
MPTNIRVIRSIRGSKKVSGVAGLCSLLDLNLADGA